MFGKPRSLYVLRYAHSSYAHRIIPQDNNGDDVQRYSSYFFYF